MTYDVASGRYVGEEAPNLLVKELKNSDSKGRICVKLTGSCLTAAVYFTVESVHVPTYRNRHGGVRSEAVAEANIFR